MGLSQGTAYFDAPSVESAISETARKIHAHDFSADYTTIGYPTTWSGLFVTFGSFYAYIGGVRMIFNPIVIPVIANKDNYIDIGQDGVIDINSVTIGAAAPALQTNHIRVFLFTTNTTDVTVIQSLRPPIPQGSWIEGLKVEFVSATQIRVSSGACYIPGSQRIVHTKSKDPMATKTVTPHTISVGFGTTGGWHSIYVFEGSNGYLDWIAIRDDVGSYYPGWDGGSPTARVRQADLTEDYRYIGDVKAYDATRLMRFYDTGEGGYIHRRWEESVYTGGQLLFVNNGGVGVSSIIDVAPRGVPYHTAAVDVDVWAYNAHASGFIYLAEQVPSFTHSATEFQSLVPPASTTNERFPITAPSPWSVRYMAPGGSGAYLAVAGYGYER